MKNPFSVKTPETLTPEDIASLFIDVFSDFPRLLATEHTFLHGPRGSGKSMMLRYLEPQVHLAAGKVQNANELPHFAVHMPIKKASYSLTELERLKGAPYSLLAEHILIINASKHILNSLLSLIENKDHNKTEIDRFFKKVRRLSESCGSRYESDLIEDASSEDLIEELSELLDEELRKAKHYIRDLAFDGSIKPYSEAIFGYDDFFLPFLKQIRKLEITPQGPIFLMLDDADNLSIGMQKIVNGWVSYRSTQDLCLKVSTQQRYKTWRTPNNILIESPHDFSEIDIRNVYTSKQSSHYFDRVKCIVKRRLEISKSPIVEPEEFFPTNSKQENRLEEIKNIIRKNWEEGNGVSSRVHDDITRYTFSEHLKDLAKVKKTNTLSYAGFKTMVDLSSGMIRNFLEPASLMFSELHAAKGTEEISFIPCETQSTVIYNWSQDFVLENFDKIEQDERSSKPDDTETCKRKIERLKTLITSLGECFQAKLLSDDTERRYISFTISSPPESKTLEILNTAVEWGYLQRSTIAKKDGIGRSTLYILNRRLTPYFKLDPSGYAAHMSITPELIELAATDTKAFVRDRLKNSTAHKFEQKQQILL